MADLHPARNVFPGKRAAGAFGLTGRGEGEADPNRFSLSYIGIVRSMFLPDHSRPR